MKRFKRFPENCSGCPYQSPTGLCMKLFDLDRFLKSGGINLFNTCYRKRKKHCPLTEQELKELKNVYDKEESK